MNANAETKVNIVPKKKQKHSKLTKKVISSFQAGNLKNALKFSLQAIAVAPDNHICQSIAGRIYQKAGQNEKSLPYFEYALKYDPKNVQYSYQLGMVYKILNRFEEGLVQLLNALEHDSDNLICLNEISLLYIDLGNLSIAKQYLQRAYALNAVDLTTLVNMAFLFFREKSLEQAILFAEKAINIEPKHAESHYIIGHSLILANHIEKGIEFVQLSINYSSVNASLKHRTLLMSYLYDDHCSYEKIFQEHKNWAKEYLEYGKYPAKKINDPTKKIKIGWVSPDFFEHPISHFLMPIVQSYDKNRFEYYCYSGVLKPDAVTQKIENNVDYWRNISTLSSEKIAELVRQDDIDILIDLVGHTANKYIHVFAHKPAPIQITYLGYPFSTGLTSMDYRISDEYADPINESEQLHTEKLVHISPSFLCYQPMNEIPIEKEIPFVKNNYITFASFNNLNKLSKKTILLWSEILLSVPNSMLALKGSMGLSNLLKENILAQFFSNDIPSNRLIFFDYQNDRTSHFSMYNKVDICLDTFPYNGTTTTYEALWMGVPVITLCGGGHPSRVGYSILQNMGLDNLIAESDQEYVVIANELAADLPKIQEYRDTLRGQLLSSPLTDARQFSKELGNVLKNIWQVYCEKINR